MSDWQGHLLSCFGQLKRTYRWPLQLCDQYKGKVTGRAHQFRASFEGVITPQLHSLPKNGSTGLREGCYRVTRLILRSTVSCFLVFKIQTPQNNCKKIKPILSGVAAQETKDLKRPFFPPSGNWLYSRVLHWQETNYIHLRCHTCTQKGLAGKAPFCILQPPQSMNVQADRICETPTSEFHFHTTGSSIQLHSTLSTLSKVRALK